MNDGDLSCLQRYFDEVSPLFLGDDNIYGVHPRIAKTYTPKLIAETVAYEGHIYTSVDKGPAPSVLDTLENSSVLKRGFRKCRDGFYDAPLELDTVLEMPMWTRDNADRLVIAQQNMDTAIRELSLHGKEVFEEWIPKFRKFAGTEYKPFCEDWFTVHSMVSCRNR